MCGGGGYGRCSQKSITCYRNNRNQQQPDQGRAGQQGPNACGLTNGTTQIAQNAGRSTRKKKTDSIHFRSPESQFAHNAGIIELFFARSSKPIPFQPTVSTAHLLTIINTVSSVPRTWMRIRYVICPKLFEERKWQGLAHVTSANSIWIERKSETGPRLEKRETIHAVKRGDIKSIESKHRLCVNLVKGIGVRGFPLPNIVATSVARLSPPSVFVFMTTTTACCIFYLSLDCVAVMLGTIFGQQSRTVCSDSLFSPWFYFCCVHFSLGRKNQNKPSISLLPAKRGPGKRNNYAGVQQQQLFEPACAVRRAICTWRPTHIHPSWSSSL